MMRRPTTPAAGAANERTGGAVPKIVRAVKREFVAPSGRRWEADFCMHAGTDEQAPNLMVIFHDPLRVVPDRYNLLPPGSPKLPKEAAKQISDDTLRALLRRSVPVKWK
jgi:hypothetical protein